MTSPSNVTQFPRLALTASQAARYLGVSLSTVRRWSDAGALPSFRTPGGQRRFNAGQLDEFLASLQSRRATSYGERAGTGRAPPVRAALSGAGC